MLIVRYTQENAVVSLTKELDRVGGKTTDQSAAASSGGAPKDSGIGKAHADRITSHPATGVRHRQDLDSCESETRTKALAIVCDDAQVRLSGQRSLSIGSSCLRSTPCVKKFVSIFNQVNSA